MHALENIYFLLQNVKAKVLQVSYLIILSFLQMKQDFKMSSLRCSLNLLQPVFSYTHNMDKEYLSELVTSCMKEYLMVLCTGPVDPYQSPVVDLTGSVTKFA